MTPSKALVTVIDGLLYEQIAKITMPSLERYAERHGYDIIVTPSAPDMPAVEWSKPIRLLEALEDHDFAMWIDIDAVIASNAPDLSDRILGTPAFQSLVWLPYGPGGGFISLGVWGMRRCAQSTKFLKDCLKRLRYHRPGLNEAEAVWHLLDGGHTANRIDTTLLNERWNSRRIDNAPHVFHATGWRERADRQRCMNLLRAFIDADTPSETVTDPGHVSVVFDTADYLETIERCAIAVSADADPDQFAPLFDLLTLNIPGYTTPDLRVQIMERLDRLTLAATS